MSILQDMAGMGSMTEQVIATDFLISSKSAIKNYAVALSETASPQVKQVLKKQLNTAIETHDKISNYMITKGYYHAYNPQEQFKADMSILNTTMTM